MKWALKRDLYFLVRTPYFIPKRLYRQKLQKFGSLLTGQIADIGCGLQWNREFIRSTLYLPLDLNLKLNPGIVANAQAIPFTDASLDGVLCTEVIEHVRFPDKVMAEISRILKPGGMLLLTAPMSWNLHYEPADFFRFTCYGLDELAQRSGLEPIQIERIGGAFSLIGARLAEVTYNLASRALFLLPMPWKAVFACLATAMPISLFFYVIACALDRVDRTDAIGWVMLARKK